MNGTSLTLEKPAVGQKQNPPFLRSLFDWSLIGFVTAFLAFAPWFYGLTRFRDQLAAQCVLFTAFLISYPLIDWKSSFRPGTNEVDFWVALTGVVSLCYAVFSALPYSSFLAFSKLLSLILLYGLVRSVAKTSGRIQVFLWAIVIIGFFYAGYGLAQYYDFLPHAYWSLPYGLASRFVNSSHFSVFLLFPLLTGFSLLISSKNLLAKLFLLVPLGTMGLTLILARSRAGWLVFLIGLVVFFWQTSRGQLTRSKNVWSFLLLGAAAAAILLSRVGGFELVSSRILDLQKSNFFSLINRLDLWKGAFLAIRERPWGWGLGTFGWVFPQFEVRSDRFLVDYAHNEFFQTGVDMGIPGLLILSAFLVFYFRRAFHFVKQGEFSSVVRTIGAGFTALFVSLVIASQVDFPLRIYANGAFFITFLALSAHFFEPLTAKKQIAKRQLLIRWSVPILVFLTGVLSGRQLLAEISFQKARVLDQNFKWDEAMAKYQEAENLVPFHALYHEALGGLYYRKSSLSFQKDEKSKFRQKAMEAYRRATQILPYNANTHRQLGLLLEEVGESEGARQHLKEAVRLAPQDGSYLTEYANFAARHSLTKEALLTFEKLMSLPYWGDGTETVCSVLKKSYQLTRDYHKVLAITPDDHRGHLCLAYALEEEGQLDQAKIEFERSMALLNLTAPQEAEQIRERLHSRFEAHAVPINENSNSVTPNA